MSRSRVATLIVVLLWSALLLAQGQQPLADPWVDYVAGEYDIVPDITYHTANNVDLKLDLYVSKDRSRLRPAVLLFHGGGWVAGQKERNVLQLLPYLRLGWVAVNIEYRIARNSLAPAAVEDCRCALRWVWSHAAEYGIDRSKLVLTGGSAGGHLALITGMLPQYSQFDRQCPTDGNMRWSDAQEPAAAVAAIVNWYGITDVAELLQGPNAKHYAIEWFGSMREREQLAREVSPISYVRKGLPPIITIHGSEDNVVPYAQATRLHAALDAAGVPNKLVTVTGGKHGGFDRKTMIECFTEIREFLRKHGLVAQ
ncbi:MAG: alpha/beta hydrolase [bacterium]|nr:alpha/beta hydrolase [candidate division KSB1 bacterium]MDH7560895.1 alpha/beta hydrolase [bacterium]